MEKMNRSITQQQLDFSRDKNIDAVMQSVGQTQSKSIFSMFILKPKYITAFVLMIAVVLTVTFGDFGSNTNPIDDPDISIVDNTDTPIVNELALNENTVQTLTEMSYISGSLMSSGFTVSSDVFIQLAAPIKKTEIGTNIEEVNTYFDMLKVFLEDDPFGDSIVVEELVDEEYQSKITFTSEGNEFVFYINLDQQDIEGVLYINDVLYTVEGKQTQEETESKLQLKASNGNDYVDVEYKTDSEDLETTQKYNVETSFDGVVTQKDIKVTLEDGSLKVTIEDLNSKYNLKKNIEDDEGAYKLDYTIDGEKSRASIYEDVDVEGNPVYRYEIREANLTETIIIPILTSDSEEQRTSFDEESKQIYLT